MNPPTRNRTGSQPPTPGAALAIGIGVGTSFGVAMDKVALGIGLGTALGLVFAVVLAALARRSPKQS